MQAQEQAEKPVVPVVTQPGGETSIPGVKEGSGPPQEKPPPGTTCPAGQTWDGTKCVVTALAPTTTTTKSTPWGLIIGGVVVLGGIAWLVMRGGGMAVAENPGRRFYIRRTRHGYSAVLVDGRGNSVNVINGGPRDSEDAIRQAVQKHWLGVKEVGASRWASPASNPDNRERAKNIALQVHGEKMQHWHSSGGDPIYAVGSYHFTGKLHPSRDTVERAESNLWRILESGGLSQTDRNELQRLIRDMHKFYPWLSAKA